VQDCDAHLPESNFQICSRRRIVCAGAILEMEEKNGLGRAAGICLLVVMRMGIGEEKPLGTGKSGRLSEGGL